MLATSANVRGCRDAKLRDAAAAMPQFSAEQRAGLASEDRRVPELTPGGIRDHICVTANAISDGQQVLAAEHETISGPVSFR